MNMSDIADRLRLLEVENNLDPVAVVEDARDPTSPLHGFFEWDDTAAAQQYRLGQARQLIRRVKIEVTVRDIPLNVVRYVRDPDTSGYRNITTVRNEADTARRVIIDEMDRVSKAAKRARAIAAVLGTAGDVDEILRLAGQVVQAVTNAESAPAGNA